MFTKRKSSQLIEDGRRLVYFICVLGYDHLEG